MFLHFRGIGFVHFWAEVAFESIFSLSQINPHIIFFWSSHAHFSFQMKKGKYEYFYYTQSNYPCDIFVHTLSKEQTFFNEQKAITKRVDFSDYFTILHHLKIEMRNMSLQETDSIFKLFSLFFGTYNIDSNKV